MCEGVSYVAPAFEPSRRLVSVVGCNSISLGIDRSRFGEAVFEIERERGNRWMASAVAEDGARATLSENRCKTAGGRKCVIVNRAKACSVWSLETTAETMGGSVTGVDGGRRRPMDVKTDGCLRKVASWDEGVQTSFTSVTALSGGRNA